MTAVNPRTRLELEKRNVPPVIRKLLEWDVVATKRLVSFLMGKNAIISFKRHCKFLEWSCHGAVWLACWAAFCYMIDDSELYQCQINMFFGLILDILFVWILKAATRRRRPSPDDNPLSFGPDKFSFPSGHASRAVFVAAFFTALWPSWLIFYPPLVAWAAAVCLSRLVLFRHHILDILAGVALGLFEALILAVLWLDQDTCAWIINRMTDEKLSGPEYDV